MQDFKHHFPFCTLHPDLVYLDSAATTQKPQEVIDAVTKHLSTSANAGRGSYSLATKKASVIESTREVVAQFINTAGAHEIVFTSGATESLNLVALSWGLHNLTDGDEIVYCPLDHSSTVLPWVVLQKTLSKQGIEVKLVPFVLSPLSDVTTQEVLKKVSKQTRLIVLTHIHNVFGSKIDIENIRKNISPSVRISLDASQSIGHIPLDVQTLGADFVSFSGHKMFAPEGVGVLFIRDEIRSQMVPLKVGGGATSSANQNQTLTPHNPSATPQSLEVGTLNAAGIVGLGAAIAFINQIGVQNIAQHSHILTGMLIKKLQLMTHVELVPSVTSNAEQVPRSIVSIRVKEIPSQEVGFALGQKGILVRTGSHCAARGPAEHDVIRVSTHIYNNERDIDTLVFVLNQFALDSVTPLTEKT